MSVKRSVTVPRGSSRCTAAGAPSALAAADPRNRASAGGTGGAAVAASLSVRIPNFGRLEVDLDLPLRLVVGPVDADVRVRTVAVVLELDDPSVTVDDLPHAVVELSVGHVAAPTLLQLRARCARNPEPRQRHKDLLAVSLDHPRRGRKFQGVLPAACGRRRDGARVRRPHGGRLTTQRLSTLTTSNCSLT